MDGFRVYFKGKAKGFSDGLDAGYEIKREIKGNWITPKFLFFFFLPQSLNKESRS